jgi:hypothetical protein
MVDKLSSSLTLDLILLRPVLFHLLPDEVSASVKSEEVVQKRLELGVIAMNPFAFTVEIALNYLGAKLSSRAKSFSYHRIASHHHLSFISLMYETSIYLSIVR